MAIGRHLEPHLPVARKRRDACGIAKLRIEQRVLVLINEDKKPAGRRPEDLRKFFPSGDVADAGHVQGGEILRVTIDRLAHVVTPISELRQLLPIWRLDRGKVRRAMVNRH